MWFLALQVLTLASGVWLEHPTCAVAIMFRSIVEIQGYTCTACELFAWTSFLKSWTFCMNEPTLRSSMYKSIPHGKKQRENNDTHEHQAHQHGKFREPVQKKLLLRVEVKDLDISTQSFLFFILVAC